LLVAALCAGSSAAAHAQVTSVNGQIAYVACGPGTQPFFSTQCDIWVMNPDGSGQTNVTNTTDLNETNPAWSADGTRIAYVEGYNGVNTLMVVNADGTNRVAVTAGPSYQFGPTWSPGGTQLAFVRYRDGSPVSIQADIMVIDLETGNETVISRPVSFGGALADADEIDPAWSPDGTQIAFAGVRPEQYVDSLTGALVDGAQWEIVVVRPDGSGEQVLSAGDPGTPRAQYLEEDRAPAWSPDSSQLVFMSQAQIPACCGPWQIWAVNRDGSGARNLTNDETVNDLYPSWSPDGTQIIFSRAVDLGFDLYTMPAPTGVAAAAGLAVNRAAALAAATAATPLTTDGNASDSDWGRNPDAAPGNQTYTLFVSVNAPGHGVGGSVTSRPAGIKCGKDCSETYAAGTLVTLTAAAKHGARLAGWSGACSGTAPTCVVTMNDVKSATARFARRTR
jgi:dipeptidyl aminopeptidase/acylaminoacyl peptidase